MFHAFSFYWALTIEEEKNFALQNILPSGCQKRSKKRLFGAKIFYAFQKGQFPALHRVAARKLRELRERYCIAEKRSHPLAAVRGRFWCCRRRDNKNRYSGKTGNWAGDRRGTKSNPVSAKKITKELEAEECNQFAGPSFS